MAGNKQASKGWTPDRRPARPRYWLHKHLQGNKVRAIMRNTGLGREDAEKLWLESRGGRRMGPKNRVESRLGLRREVS